MDGVAYVGFLIQYCGACVGCPLYDRCLGHPLLWLVIDLLRGRMLVVKDNIDNNLSLGIGWQEVVVGDAVVDGKACDVVACAMDIYSDVGVAVFQ